MHYESLKSQWKDFEVKGELRDKLPWFPYLKWQCSWNSFLQNNLHRTSKHASEISTAVMANYNIIKWWQLFFLWYFCCLLASTSSLQAPFGDISSSCLKLDPWITLGLTSCLIWVKACTQIQLQKCWGKFGVEWNDQGHSKGTLLLLQAGLCIACAAWL